MCDKGAGKELTVSAENCFHAILACYSETLFSRHIGTPQKSILIIEVSSFQGVFTSKVDLHCNDGGVWDTFKCPVCPHLGIGRVLL